MKKRTTLSYIKDIDCNYIYLCIYSCFLFIIANNRRHNHENNYISKYQYFLSPSFFYISRLILLKKSVKSNLSLPFLKFCFLQHLILNLFVQFCVLVRLSANSCKICIHIFLRFLLLSYRQSIHRIARH